MNKHETKHCPRCKISFECKSGSIGLCQCRRVSITDEVHHFINNRFSDCLCAQCLEEMRSEYHQRNFNASVRKALGDR
ncbi:cysteine-rich CWC family protein [Pseudochryseolinea flava]|uniref:Cysteine-rich CWC n=1 Tax=Pseudochryseolinea flava TaxID=2059302 RepID=A0A364Y2I2_9BACT|nr:hypothetical protein DQQ10_12050 [Pseudochryseolinea flava]